MRCLSMEKRERPRRLKPIKPTKDYKIGAGPRLMISDLCELFSPSFDLRSESQAKADTGVGVRN